MIFEEYNILQVFLCTCIC